jgi:hypothetical protein
MIVTVALKTIGVVTVLQNKAQLKIKVRKRDRKVKTSTHQQLNQLQVHRRTLALVWKDLRLNHSEQE